MARLTLGGSSGDLAGMLTEVSAAQTRLQSAPRRQEDEGEVATLSMTIAACKADLIDLLDQVESGSSLDDEDTEMLVDFLRSEIKMVMSRLQAVVAAQQSRRMRRLMDRS